MRVAVDVLGLDDAVVLAGVARHDPLGDRLVVVGRARADGHLATWRLRVDDDPPVVGPLAAGGARVLKGQRVEFFVTMRDVLAAQLARDERERAARERPR